MSSLPWPVHYLILLLWSVLPSPGRKFRMASGDDERNLFPSGESGGSLLVDQETEHGFDYKFVSKVDPMYECPICLLVLRNPVQTECGHRFCKSCILTWKQKPGSKCPACGESLQTQSVFPDNFAKRFINNFKIFCLNQGCSEEVELGRLQDHLDSCVFCKVPCPSKCGRVLSQLDMDHHLNNECENRYVNCDICNEEILFVEKQHHQNSLCPQLNVSCQYCGEDLKKCEMMKHCEEDCQKIPISCKYKSLGCIHQPTRESMEEHRKTSIQDHMDLLLEELMTLSGMFYSFREKEKKERKKNDTVPLSSSLHPPQPFSFMHPHFKRFSKDEKDKTFHSDPYVNVHNLQTQMEDLSLPPGDPNSSPGDSNTDFLKGDTDFLKSEFLRMRTHLSDKTVALEDSTARMGKLENRIEEQGRLIREVTAKMTEMESRFCRGCYIWKVPNYRKLKEEAVSGSNTVLHSPGFYSSVYGYRLCIRLNVNGVDAATGRHMSLFVHFMKGDYDELVPWPFRGKITLSVLDQNDYYEDRQHLSEVLIAKPRLAAFQKPMTQRNHKGFGYMEYAPIALIESATYIKNDTLCVRAHVEHDAELLHEKAF